MKKILFIATAAMLLQSCVSVHLATYDIKLSQVEAPQNAKEQFGETKIVSYQEGDQNKYKYSDAYIDIVWHVGIDRLYFDVKNNTTHTIKIDWDAISFIDTDNRACRVIHSGIKYTDKNNSQATTSLPRGASMNDILMPVENILWRGSSWEVANLIPSYYKNTKVLEENKDKYVGKKMSVAFPIEIEGVVNEYLFEFTVESFVKSEEIVTPVKLY